MSERQPSPFWTATVYGPSGNVVQGPIPVSVNQTWTVFPEWPRPVPDYAPKPGPTEGGRAVDCEISRRGNLIDLAKASQRCNLSDRREVQRKLASWPVCAPCGKAMEFIGINPCPGRRDAVFSCPLCASSQKVKLK